MKVTLTHGDKSVELDLTAEQMASLGLKEEKKKTGYERVEIGSLYLVDGAQNLLTTLLDHRDILDNAHYEIARYYSDKTVAENNSRADTLMRKLRRFAAENGGIPKCEEWLDSRSRKYCVGYEVSENKLVDDWNAQFKIQGVVYFKTEEACQKAIEEFHDELIWYFTEYQAMLY